MKHILAFLFILGLSTQSHSLSFFSKKLQYKSKTAPTSDLRLKRIGFYSKDGHAKNLERLLISSFENEGIEVVSTNELLSRELRREGDQAVLDEFALHFGETAIFVIDSIRVFPDRSRRYEKDKEGKYTYYHTLKYNMQMDIKLINLANNRRLRTFSFNDTIKKETSTENRHSSEEPSARDAEQELLRRFSRKITALYLPRSFYKSLKFFPEKKHGSKKAYNALKDGNYKLALELAEDALSSTQNYAKAKSKHIAHAHYNLGVALFLNKKYDAAISEITQAISTHDNKAYSKTIAKIEAERENDEKLQAWVESDNVIGAKPLPTVAQIAEVSAGPTQEELIAKMKKYKKLLDEGLINQETYDKKIAPIIDQIEF